MIFKIPGSPKGKGRPRFYQGHAVTPKETREYEREIAGEYISAGGKKFDGYVEIKITAFFPIPKSTTKKDRQLIEQGILLPAKKPDIDNIIKVVLDGLNGVAYGDDSQVISVFGEKKYSDNPGVLVEIIPKN